MKRYKITAEYDVAGYGTTEHEDPHGEWVKWEDVKGILQYKDQLKGYKLEAEDLKCNCEEMYDQRAYWFCPAHGYKKR